MPCAFCPVKGGPRAPLQSSVGSFRAHRAAGPAACHAELQDRGEWTLHLHPDVCGRKQRGLCDLQLAASGTPGYRVPWRVCPQCLLEAWGQGSDLHLRDQEPSQQQQLPPCLSAVLVSRYPELEQARCTAALKRTEVEGRAPVRPQGEGLTPLRGGRGRAGAGPSGEARGGPTRASVEAGGLGRRSSRGPGGP